ncbi:MAG: efflux RND transporter periplasmic adaptor subunit, partial [Planctomycetes bacterium]|nr:efflux RND transporter periplasmic adaptor subunit [Planctomycetota bacterium]
IQGVISRVHQRKGEFVRQGQPLLDVIEIDRLKLVAEVADHEVVWIRPGDRVTLTSDALPGESFAAVVHRVYPKALASSRRFQIEIELSSPQRRLRPGFFVRGEIVRDASGGEFDTAATTLVVPRAALFERYGQFFVYRIETDEAEGAGQLLAHRIPVVVRPVRSDPRIMQVSSGLSEGDRVATKGIQHLTDGVPVRIVE